MSFEELDRIDREWEKKREQYMVKTRYGLRYAPSSFAASGCCLLSISIGPILVLTAFLLAAKLGGVAWGLPVFGVVFIIGGIVISEKQRLMAARYEAAFRVYQRRRAEAEEKLKE
jgi:hypothetical protein